jgi:hypothetical protein
MFLEDDSWGNSVIKTLIPAIQRLHQDPRLSALMTFGSRTLTEEEINAPNARFHDVQVSFTNFKLNDCLLDKMGTKYVYYKPFFSG